MTETISGAKDLLRVYIDADIPTYVHGAPGVGKSDLFRQLAEERGIGFIDVRLGTMDLVDLLGLPNIVNNETNWARPVFWPQKKRDGEKGILLLDEMSDCPRAMQSAAYQLVLNRRIASHELPGGWYPCAAGNRRSDKAAAQALSTALANRFAHIDVEPDVDAFIAWANTNEISPYVAGFIRFRPQLLHNMEGTDLRAFPSPRSWAKASKVCEAEPKLRMRLMQGLVGAGAAAEFEGYMKTLDMPDLQEVLGNPKGCRIPKQPSGKYAMSAMLARYATKPNLDKVYTYIKRPEFGADFQICCMLDATKRDPNLTETKAYIQFANDNQHLHL